MHKPIAIETLSYHQSMLADRVRTRAFQRAIRKTVAPGDVVLDLGSGTGVLAYFACMAGARRVYAVEAGPVIELAKAVCRHNGFEDRVIFINDWSTNVDLPEPVDVIVTETIGNAGFEEGILHWVLDARERFLVEGGWIIPSSVELIVAPVEDHESYGYVHSWAQRLHSLDFSPARAWAVNNLGWTDLPTKSCLSDPASLVRVDTAQVTTADIAGELAFIARRDGLVHGIGAWFSAELAPGERLSNAPPLRTPSWSHVLLPLEQPLAVSEGDRVWIRVQIQYNASHWQWQVRLDGAPGYQAPHQTAVRSHQGPLSGELMAPDRAFSQGHMPARTEQAEIDLFILGAMDGVTRVAAIARAVADRFPAQFSTAESASEHIHDLMEGYSQEEDSE